MQAADIIWRQGEKRLVVGMSRLDWEQTLAGQDRAAPPDRGAALRPGAVVQVAQYRSGDARGRAGTARDRVSSRRPPRAAARCCCSAMAAALRLDVECLECELTDLGADDLGTSGLGDGADRRGWVLIAAIGPEALVSGACDSTEPRPAMHWIADSLA